MLRNSLISKKQLACKTLTHRSFVYFGSSFALRFPLSVNIIRAWDYPKIATCPDSGCACCSLKSQFSSSLRRSFSPPKSVLYCKKISGRRAFLWISNGYLPGFTRDTTESPSSLSGCSRTSTPASPSWSARIASIE